MGSNGMDKKFSNGKRLMFKVVNIEVVENPTCNVSIDTLNINNNSIEYFDKDGFELSPLEQEYYCAAGYESKIGNKCLYHTCWQEPWFILEHSDNFLIDHTMILHRCNFTGDAIYQLQQYNKNFPRLNYLINCKKKWGLDFSLDYVDVDSNKIYEIVHIEQDTNNYQEFLELKEKFEKFVLSTDWCYATKILLKERESWLHLEGMSRNDWKARFFGYSQAEHTLKSI